MRAEEAILPKFRIDYLPSEGLGDSQEVECDRVTLEGDAYVFYKREEAATTYPQEVIGFINKGYVLSVLKVGE